MASANSANPDAQRGSIGWIIPAALYALLLGLTIRNSSLWTDEAFSAWVAAHRHFANVLQCLVAGDSSDLQMGLYYVYLHFWSSIFGLGEFALRTSNIPFILLLSGTLMWSARRLFASRISWIAPALLPFLWRYAGEARPYFAVTALSAAAIACLLALIFLKPAGNRARTIIAVLLGTILVGTAMHMLFLLLLPPLFVILLFASRDGAFSFRWRDWKVPVFSFAVPYAVLAAFLVYTFTRGTAYDYPPATLKATAAIFYDLAGFATLGPDRRFAAVTTANSSLLIVCGTILACATALAIVALCRGTRISFRLRTSLWLLAASVLAVAEVVALTLAIHQQLDQRHLAAVVPLFLFLLLAALSVPSRTTVVAILLIAGTWLVADVRGAIMPVYQREDYRDAIQVVLALHAKYGGDVVVATDPVAPAYYGLSVTGPSPCFPFPVSCADALNQVAWHGRVAGIEAAEWPRGDIDRWIAFERKQPRPVIAIIELDRSHKHLAWPSAMRDQPGVQFIEVHGFTIAFVPPVAGVPPGAAVLSDAIR